MDAAIASGQQLTDEILYRANDKALTLLSRLGASGMSASSVAIQGMVRVGLEALREMSGSLCQLFVETLGPDLDQLVASRFIQAQLNNVLPFFQNNVDRQVANLPGSSDYGFTSQAAAIVEHAPAELQVAAAKANQKRSAPPPLAPLGSELDMAFVRNPVLRNIAAINSSEAARCLADGAHNASVAMAGSALEAVVLDAVKTVPEQATEAEGAPPEPLEKWDLADLIKVAIAIDLIGNDTGSLTNWIRGHRNLIHPGRVLRLGSEIGGEEAQLAFDILRLVCKELRTRNAE